MQQTTLNSIRNLQKRIINNHITNANAIKEIIFILEQTNHILIKNESKRYEYEQLIGHIVEMKKQISLKEIKKISKKLELDNARLDIENKKLINMINSTFNK